MRARGGQARFGEEATIADPERKIHFLDDSRADGRTGGTRREMRKGSRDRSVPTLKDHTAVLESVPVLHRELEDIHPSKDLSEVPGFKADGSADWSAPEIGKRLLEYWRKKNHRNGVAIGMANFTR